MALISSAIKTRYQQAASNAKVTLARHPQRTITDELQNIACSIEEHDSRDIYGIGGTIAAFEAQVASLFNKPSGLFLPTGTLAQCAAMKCYSEVSGKPNVALHPTSHLLIHEHMAIEALWGLNVSQYGKFHSVVKASDLYELDPTTTCALIVELPMREIGGALPSWQDLLEIRQWCDTNQVKMHMDGARIWQTTTYYERHLSDIAQLFDSIYVSFYKDLGGIFGAALVADTSLIDRARIWARRAGGNPITLYPEVLAARKGLQNYLPKMPHYAAYTTALCNAFKDLPVSVIPEQPQASMFHLKFEMSPEALVTKLAQYAEQTGILVLPLPRAGDANHSVCEVTIGNNALSHPVEFWVKHLAECLR